MLECLGRAQQMVINERCPTGTIRNAKMLKHVISGKNLGSTVFFAWKKHRFPWLDVFFISKDCLAPKSEGMNYHTSPLQIAGPLFGAKRDFWCAKKLGEIATSFFRKIEVDESERLRHFIISSPYIYTSPSVWMQESLCLLRTYPGWPGCSEESGGGDHI